MPFGVLLKKKKKEGKKNGEKRFLLNFTAGGGGRGDKKCDAGAPEAPGACSRRSFHRCLSCSYTYEELKMHRTLKKKVLNMKFKWKIAVGRL